MSGIIKTGARFLAEAGSMAKEGLSKRARGLKAAGSAFMEQRPGPQLTSSTTWQHPRSKDDLDLFLTQKFGKNHAKLWHGTPEPEAIWKQVKQHKDYAMIIDSSKNKNGGKGLFGIGTHEACKQYCSRSGVLDYFQFATRDEHVRIEGASEGGNGYVYIEGGAETVLVQVKTVKEEDLAEYHEKLRTHRTYTCREGVSKAREAYRKNVHPEKTK